MRAEVRFPQLRLQFVDAVLVLETANQAINGGNVRLAATGYVSRKFDMVALRCAAADFTCCFFVLVDDTTHQLAEGAALASFGKPHACYSQGRTGEGIARPVAAGIFKLVFFI